jgi:hypothetical protein
LSQKEFIILHQYTEMFPSSDKQVRRKGKNAFATENRRIVWECIVWPLILQINRQYFTLEEYHIKQNRFCEIYTNISHKRLSRGLISLIKKGILMKTKKGYSLHYRLVPYMYRRVLIDYGLAMKETSSK